ncbi:hypothetical protein DDE83_006232 [Stemphylium lycopersici]|uniref:Uncharacterized protein n=1 Tax=Stemphylium lycopersici TaxID=183478 RepID=A0A364MZG6_STELY|nr:hypothetical protein DDE83_006232 [Stemphylium lycopersici]
MVTPNTPAPTSPPATRRGRGVRVASIASSTPLSTDTQSQATNPSVKAATKIPGYYKLAPTYPSPFSGTLEASLDAILAFSSLYSGITGVSALITSLLQDPKPDVYWGLLLSQLTFSAPAFARHITTELFFLATRTLLPEQITENRSLLARLYDRKKQLAIRLLLRYDMLREWKMESGSGPRDTPVTVASLPPPPPPPATTSHQPPAAQTPVSPSSAAYEAKYPHRRPLLPNILPTLIAAPPGGFTTHAVRERMRHHVTGLDDYLVLTDEDVEGWGEWLLRLKTSQVLLHWQWLRRNNAFLGDMEVSGWEELEARADECVWIADDVRRTMVKAGLGVVAGASASGSGGTEGKQG